MRSIIVSADDFGISRLASENILKLVKLGKVDRVEVMTSENISPSQVEELVNSGVKIDVHLHFAKDKLDFWQNNERKIETSAVRRGVKFLWNYIFGDGSVRNIEKEWLSQVESFIKIFGKVPDGISSHEYVHFFPPYFKCVLGLCEKFGIKYIRFGKKDLESRNIISKILNWLRKINIENLNKASLNSSDFMVSFDWTGNLDFVSKKDFGNNSVEVVFHPEKENEFNALKNLE